MLLLLRRRPVSRRAVVRLGHVLVFGRGGVGGGGEALGGPVALDDEPGRDGAEHADEAERPPGDDGVAVAGAPREEGAEGGGAGGAAQAAEGGGEAVEGAEDADRRGRVGQQDGDAGEADDAGDALGQEEDEEGGVARRRVLDQAGVGGQEVDDGEDGHWSCPALAV